MEVARRTVKCFGGHRANGADFDVSAVQAVLLEYERREYPSYATYERRALACPVAGNGGNRGGDTGSSVADGEPEPQAEGDFPRTALALHQKHPVLWLIPASSFDADDYTLERLYEAAEDFGWYPEIVRADQLFPLVGADSGAPLVLPAGVDMPDAVFNRMGALCCNHVVNAMETLEAAGAVVINGAAATRFGVDKWAQHVQWRRDGLPCPKAALVTNHADIDDLWRAFGGPVVVKLTASTCGKDVHCARTPHRLRVLLDELATPTSPVMVEEFIASAAGHDLRVPCIGHGVRSVYRPMRRRAADADEFRANLALGGKPYLAELDDELRHVVARAKASLDMDVVGIDVLEPEEPWHGHRYVLLEANMSLDTRGYDDTYQTNLAHDIVRHLSDCFRLSLGERADDLLMPEC